MFPRRLQPVLDAWIGNCFDTTTFLQTCEWSHIWGFDPDLYLPLFHFCRQHRIRMVAMNCPRPLVSRVGREGWAAIPEHERDGVTPARPAMDAHRRYLFDLIGAAGGAIAALDPSFDRFVRAQQVWDRAFACNIAAALADGGPPSSSASSGAAMSSMATAHRSSWRTSASRTWPSCCRPMRTASPSSATAALPMPCSGWTNPIRRKPPVRRSPAGPRHERDV